jgi:hypothetical protein
MKRLVIKLAAGSPTGIVEAAIAVRATSRLLAHSQQNEFASPRITTELRTGDTSHLGQNRITILRLDSGSP